MDVFRPWDLLTQSDYSQLLWQALFWAMIAGAGLVVFDKLTDGV